MNEGVKWSYFNKFQKIIDKYMPLRGEGETHASQIVTAINRLIYKWYNDGDVYDNTYALHGWANDLSSFANWLDSYVFDTKFILSLIKEVTCEQDYELILKELADRCLNEKFLSQYNKDVKVGSIFNCEGKYKFIYYEEDDELEDEDEEM